MCALNAGVADAVVLFVEEDGSATVFSTVVERIVGDHFDGWGAMREGSESGGSGT